MFDRENFISVGQRVEGKSIEFIYKLNISINTIFFVLFSSFLIYYVSLFERRLNFLIVPSSLLFVVTVVLSIYRIYIKIDRENQKLVYRKWLFFTIKSDAIDVSKSKELILKYYQAKKRWILKISDEKIEKNLLEFKDFNFVMVEAKMMMRSLNIKLKVIKGEKISEYFPEDGDEPFIVKLIMNEEKLYEIEKDFTDIYVINNEAISEIFIKSRLSIMAHFIFLVFIFLVTRSLVSEILVRKDEVIISILLILDFSLIYNYMKNIFRITNIIIDDGKIFIQELFILKRNIISAKLDYLLDILVENDSLYFLFVSRCCKIPVGIERAENLYNKIVQSMEYISQHQSINEKVSEAVEEI